MFNPKVSIIIPVYNGSNFLGNAIESALNQTYTNIEILVINDGSNDNGKTDNIAISFGKKIQYYYKENGGVSTALNLGIKKSSGEYISWLSHDDIYFPKKIEKQILYLKNIQNKECVISSGVEIINSTGKKINRSILSYKNGTIVKSLFHDGVIHGCTLLISKNIFKNLGLFNITLKATQDYEMWYRIAKDYNFYHIEDYLIQIRQHENQGSVTMRKSALLEDIKLRINVYRRYGIKRLKKEFLIKENLYGVFKIYSILIKSLLHLSILYLFCIIKNK